ncbi:MAG TPA: fumarylacetoacetase [Candidatus Aquilonibacter sp.]|nr:fumarylacetoacetase [Candidatus Aquilonibacter sp.]
MPHVHSWVEIPDGSDFSIYNLPYGAFRADGGRTHLGIAIGTKILDLHEVAGAGLLDDLLDRRFLQAERLNPFLSLGRETWKAVRFRIASLLRTDSAADERLRNLNAASFFVEQAQARMAMPVDVGDYVDFYSSIEHATNLGKLFRPNGEALMPNWRHLPIGYHGRSSTIVVDGTPVVRPKGQRKPPNADVPIFGPSVKLDIELEVGFITGPSNAMGEPISIANARDHIFGLVLVNDWSARDIQAWEYQPLGPFLGKSFATTISPWIVTLDALDPFRKASPEQEPAPLPYLRTGERWAYDIQLEVDLRTERMRRGGAAPHPVSRTNFKEMYWTMAQQLAHATVNGTMIRPGDLYASGTISGTTPDSFGSFIELTWNGTKPIDLPDGERRTFLEDGDEVTLRGWCEAGDFRVGFGKASGTIVPSR